MFEYFVTREIVWFSVNKLLRLSKIDKDKKTLKHSRICTRNYVHCPITTSCSSNSSSDILFLYPNECACFVYTEICFLRWGKQPEQWCMWLISNRQIYDPTTSLYEISNLVGKSTRPYPNISLSLVNRNREVIIYSSQGINYLCIISLFC